MALEQTLETLGYQDSVNFLRTEGCDWASAPDQAHVFRTAAKQCSLHGVYVLRPSPNSCNSIVPVTYVCEAADEAAADRIHQRVWNQNIVPFVLVQTPKCVRLYSGFRYGATPAAWGGDPVGRGLLETVASLAEVAQQLVGLHAESIDSGRIWQEWGDQITSNTRVDYKLLENLRTLDQHLREDGLDRTASHALIGKFVYLKYLRDRGILSERKLLKRWGIHPTSVFSRKATCKSFWTVNDKLDKWLNGAVFPLEPSCRSALKRRHIRQVAGVFSGDTPDGQLHLGFQAYDFSFIPIETLSVIYEQFLHTPDKQGQKSKGKDAGAYYTPIPLVSFVLGELDEKRPLTEGMTVLDPTCGSGAFLVQCYRRLIERKLQSSEKDKLRPKELRKLLVDHIFGVDSDPDACQVAELSLILTLLDYIDPPDLESQPQFLLPTLRDKNIFRADFFDPESDWAKAAGNTQFDWIVGNPPWVQLNSKQLSEEYSHVWRWMNDNETEHPVGKNQAAEAFAWKVRCYLREDSLVGLVLPAMTLFKKASESFRSKFFTQNDVWCIANFANLAYVLFAGRAQRPAAAFFYRLSNKELPTSAAPDEAIDTSGDTGRSPILTYAPFVVNQEANRPDKPGRKKTTWSIAVNSTEMREIPFSGAASGSMLPWKLAMWGSHRDARLVERMSDRFSAFAKFAKKNGIIAHEGFQLRDRPGNEEDIGKTVDFLPDLVGKKQVDFTKLRGCGRIFTFPEKAISYISEDQAYLRIRGGRAGLDVSKPPHIILDASRRFAVYSDEFMAVPARQIGIAAAPGGETLLRALAVYLNSDFVTYQQFLTCPEWGVSTNRATLENLRTLPVPLDNLGSKELEEWAQLHRSLVATSSTDEKDGLCFDSDHNDRKDMAPLLRELNERVCDLMRLRANERVLIDDLVRVRMQLVHGKVTKTVVQPPSPGEMQSYLETLAHELDSFVGGQKGPRHEVIAVRDKCSSMVSINLLRKRGGQVRPLVIDADDSTAKKLRNASKSLRRKHSQWVYFDRSLKMYDGPRTYLLKPMELLHWTRTQALLDAGEVIGDTLAMGED